jgi:hypothetical protein
MMAMLRIFIMLFSELHRRVGEMDQHRMSFECRVEGGTGLGGQA